MFPEERHKLKGRSACSNCRRTPSCHPHPEPHDHRIQLPCTLQRPPSRPPNHFTAPTRAREEAAVPSYRCCHVTQRTLIRTNRVATTRRAWSCVANARLTQRDRTAASSQRAPAMRCFCRDATFTTAPLTSSWATRASQISLSDVIH